MFSSRRFWILVQQSPCPYPLACTCMCTFKAYVSLFIFNSWMMLHLIAWSHPDNHAATWLLCTVNAFPSFDLVPAGVNFRHGRETSWMHSSICWWWRWTWMPSSWFSFLKWIPCYGHFCGWTWITILAESIDMLSEWRMGPRQRILLETNPIYRVVSRRLWNGWTGLIVLKGATHRKALVFSLVLFVHVLCDDSQILCCFCAVIAAVHSQFLNRLVYTHVVLISLQLSRSKRTNWAFERSWNNQCFVVDVLCKFTVSIW